MRSRWGSRWRWSFCPPSRPRSTSRTFWAKIGGFTSYFDRLATLDSGQRVWTDPAEWFWSFKRIARLIGETVLMAYVGTLTGGIVAFALNFVASPNLTSNALIVFCARRFLEFCRTVPDVVFALVFRRRLRPRTVARRAGDRHS